MHLSLYSALVSVRDTCFMESSVSLLYVIYMFYGELCVPVRCYIHVLWRAQCPCYMLYTCFMESSVSLLDVIYMFYGELSVPTISYCSWLMRQLSSGIDQVTYTTVEV